MSEQTPQRIRVGHSPDPDDAFMFYGIQAGKVDCAGFELEQILEDIESLNRRALQGELEVSAVSIHAYPHLADKYALMSCGASMGDGYGPMIVAKQQMSPADLRSCKVAIPGKLTSAYLAMKLYLGGDFPHVVTPFDEILETVERGDADAGLIIHEGQLTYERNGLQLVKDLGIWWGEETGGLPLPLGGNVVRRDLGEETMNTLTRVLADSIAYGLDHREEALEYALGFGRGLDGGLADKFVGMYVNDLTRDYGQRGKDAITRFLDRGTSAGFVPGIDKLEFVDGK